MRWIIRYKTPISQGIATCFGKTKKEAIQDWRKTFGYFNPKLYVVINIKKDPDY